MAETEDSIMPKVSIVGTDTEPARFIGYITALVTAALTVLAAFGLNISDDQRDAILVFMGALLPVIVFIVEMIRRRVYAPATVRRIKSAHKAATTRAKNA